MDPKTVILVLAAHLLSTGGLLALIARRLPQRWGMGRWSAGLSLFGAAYGLRLGAQALPALTWVADAAMVAAALLFIAGVREFAGGAPLHRRTCLLVVAAALTAEALAFADRGHVGRHATLDLVLSLLYVWLALGAWRARHGVDAPLRRPMTLLTALIAGLAAATMLRAGDIAMHDAATMFATLGAKVYYGYASLACVLLAAGIVWIVFVRLNTQLAELATHDPLTRQLNRCGLEEALARHFGARALRPMTVLALDLDHFKRINDTHGHAVGDLVLRAVSSVLQRNVRPGDLVARTGGEEFSVYCQTADREVATALAERLRREVARLEAAPPGGGAPIRCTVSVGVAGPFDSPAGRADADARADRALYAAKAQGRDRVLACWADDAGSELPIVCGTGRA